MQTFSVSVTVVVASVVSEVVYAAAEVVSVSASVISAAVSARVAGTVSAVVCSFAAVLPQAESDKASAAKNITADFFIRSTLFIVIYNIPVVKAWEIFFHIAFKVLVVGFYNGEITVFFS